MNIAEILSTSIVISGKEFIGKHRPEPTPSAEEQAQIAFRDKQEALLNLCYSGDKAVSAPANAEYDANIASLTQEQRDTWHCAYVDPDKFSFYSELYKDENGFRPKGLVTLAQATTWVEKWRTRHDNAD